MIQSEALSLQTMPKSWKRAIRSWKATFARHSLCKINIWDTQIHVMNLYISYPLTSIQKFAREMQCQLKRSGPPSNWHSSTKRCSMKTEPGPMLWFEGRDARRRNLWRLGEKSSMMQMIGYWFYNEHIPTAPNWLRGIMATGVSWLPGCGNICWDLTCGSIWHYEYMISWNYSAL